VIGILEISEISSPDWSEWSEQDIVAQGELKKTKVRGNALFSSRGEDEGANIGRPMPIVASPTLQLA
jgi:hypothetical protein